MLPLLVLLHTPLVLLQLTLRFLLPLWLRSLVKQQRWSAVRMFHLQPLAKLQLQLGLVADQLHT